MKEKILELTGKTKHKKKKVMKLFEEVKPETEEEVLILECLETMMYEIMKCLYEEGKMMKEHVITPRPIPFPRPLPPIIVF